MKKKIIADDKFIIQQNNKYYVVNEYTYKILNSYFNDESLKEMSKKLNMNSFKLNKELKKIKKEIENIEYYEDNISLDFPLKVQWKITNRCNLHCKHCYLGNLDFYELKEEQLMKVAKMIAESNVFEVTITGGEALMVKSLHKIVAYLIKSDIKVNIFTNAILLNDFNDNLEKELNYTPMDKLDYFVSIDGMEKAHDLIRGKGNFDKTISNVSSIIKKGYRITTNSVLSKLNMKEIPKLYEYLYNLGVYKIQISNLIDSGSATSDMKLSTDDKKKFNEELINVISRLDNGSRLLYAEMPDEQDTSSIYVIDKNGKKYLQQEKWKCSAGIGKCTIDYDGEVYCCPFIKNYSLGNLLNSNFREIWNNKKRFEFLKLIAKENNNSRVCIAVKQRMNRD